MSTSKVVTFKSHDELEFERAKKLLSGALPGLVSARRKTASDLEAAATADEKARLEDLLARIDDAYEQAQLVFHDQWELVKGYDP